MDELTRTRRGVLDVQAGELRRIERDLHDGAQARLVALTMQLGRAEARLGEHPEAAELVREARGEASAAIAELRDLARGIAPPVLADRGLPAAAEAIAARSAIRATVDAELDHRPPPVVEAAAYFVVAESLTNAAKHAGADARARVTIRDGERSPGDRGRRTTAAAAQTRPEWPDRAAPPRRGARWHPRRHQLRRQRHDDPCRAAVRDVASCPAACVYRLCDTDPW